MGNDLISRSAFAEEIETLDISVAGKAARWYDAKHTVLRMIGEAPAASAVEVVRCKDCKHFMEFTEDYRQTANRDGDCRLRKFAQCDEEFAMCLYNDYCSHAERRTDD